MSVLDREMLALMRSVNEQAIMPRYNNLSPDDIEDKRGGSGGFEDPVTIADQEAEAMLFEGLAKLDPGAALVGEEVVHADPALADGLKGACWIVDPIDGTRNFANGTGPFGIMVARADAGLAVSGWIFDCRTGRLCAAHRGEGASVDGEQITARSTGEAPPVASISLLFMTPEKARAIQASVFSYYRQVDIPFSAAEQYPRLALGANDVSLFERTLAWDHAAGALWLNEAGGRAARADGSEFRVDEPHRTGLIAAASRALFDDLASRIPVEPVRQA